MTAGCSVSRCENTPSFHVSAARQRAGRVKWSAGVYAAALTRRCFCTPITTRGGKTAGPEGRGREVTSDQNTLQQSLDAFRDDSSLFDLLFLFYKTL